MEKYSTVQNVSKSNLLIERLITIVDALLACDCIQDRDRRATVLSVLNEGFQGIIHKVSRRPDNQADVMEIVLTCLNYRGSLEQLAKIVIYFDGNNAASTEPLRELMRNNFFISPVLSFSLFNELKILTANLRVSNQLLQAIYSDSLPSGCQNHFLAFQQSDEMQTLSLMLQELAGFSRQAENTHPLLKCVKRLSEDMADELKIQFDLWIAKFAKEANLESMEGGTLNKRAYNHTKVVFFLLITFKPNIYDSEQFYSSFA